MTHPEGWQVGMDVCVVVTLNVRGEPRPFTAKITKIGRRWITVDDGRHSQTRFDAVTRQIDGGNYTSPGKVCESESQYREATVVNELWRDFRLRMPLTPPEHISVDDIKRIMVAIFDSKKDGKE